MQKYILFTPLFLLILFFSCAQGEKRIVTERYTDGKERIVLVCKGDTSHMIKYLEVHPSGKTAREILYEEDGILKKSEVHLYENGDIKQEGAYKKGHRVGIWRAFFKAGKLQSLRNYNEDGKEEGLYQVYKQEGSYYYLFISGFFNNGEKRGTWKFFNRDGDVIQSVNHGAK